MEESVEQQLRIGELSRRVGVSPEVLRAWERRYGLLRPARTSGGLRLYSPADERRVRRMQEQLALGLSAAEAARSALAATDHAPGVGEQPEPDGALDHQRELLSAALDAMDAVEAHLVLDGLLARFTLRTVLREVVMPFLAELGDRWERGAASVAQEHFASNVLRGRLLSLAGGWSAGDGPLALLACGTGEAHDLPLIVFGLALRERGWRIAYLGPATPGESLREAADELRPRLVVVSAVTGVPFGADVRALKAVAEDHPLAIAGAGASEKLAAKLGAEFLEGDPVTAADHAGAQGKGKR